MRFGSNFEIIFNPNQPDVIQVNTKNVGLTQMMINRDDERLEVEVYPRNGNQDRAIEALHAYERKLDPDNTGEFGELPDEEIS